MENLASSPETTQEVAPEAEVAEAETPEVEATETEETETPDGEQSEETEGEDGEETVEEEELNIGGDKLRFPKGSVPKEVVDKLSEFSKGLEASYTKKFQDVAESRKSIESRAQVLEKMQGMTGELLKTYSMGEAIKQELAELSQVNLNQMWNSPDPQVRDQARQVSDAIRLKEMQFQQILNRVTQTEQQLEHQKAAEIERMDTEGKAVLEKRIKGFSQKAPEVIDYVVKNYNIDPQEAQRYGLNTSAAEMAYKAMLYDRMQAASKPKPKPVQTAPVKPVAKGGTANPTTPVAKMTTEQLARHLGLGRGR